MESVLRPRTRSKTDASDSVCASAMLQLQHDDDTWYPSLSSPRRWRPLNYPIHDKELLAVVRALKQVPGQMENYSDITQSDSTRYFGTLSGCTQSWCLCGQGSTRWRRSASKKTGVGPSLCGLFPHLPLPVLRPSASAGPFASGQPSSSVCGELELKVEHTMSRWSPNRTGRSLPSPDARITMLKRPPEKVKIDPHAHSRLCHGCSEGRSAVL